MKRIGDILGSSTKPTGASASGRFRIIQPAKSSSENNGERSLVGDRQSDVCPICKGKGFLVYDVPPGHPDFSKAMPCRCTQARLTTARLQSLYEASNLGFLSRLTFDSFRPDGVGLPETLRLNLHAAYDMALAFAQAPKGWLVFMGDYGCGKTHLAAAIANYCITLGGHALFIVVPDLLDHLRAAYAPNSTTGFDERLEAIRDAPLLILDDLGAHNSTPWAQEKLFQILNHRYNSQLPTVITTNQRLDELDPRITSRMVDPDLSQVHRIAAPDFRAGQAGSVFTDRDISNLSTLSLHADQTLETFSSRRANLSPEERENLQRAVVRARAFAETPQGWLVLTGKSGCGKTHLAAAIANYQVAHNRATPMFVVVPDLLDHLRATFSPMSTTTLDRLFEQVKSVSLLVLDDLGTESATSWAKEKLFQLLNYRYVARMPTVITSARSIEDIDEWLRTRMLDSSRCTIFAITAPGYRSGQSQQFTDSLESDDASQQPQDSRTQRTRRGGSRSKSRI